MGIDTIVLPKLASGLCAFGQIISDVKYNYMATAVLRLDNDAAYTRIDSAASIVMQTVLPIDARPFRDASVYGAVILVLIFRLQGLIAAHGTKERV